MDIYAYAEEIGYMADYYDFHTGLIYKIQEYGAVKNDPDSKIRVVDAMTGQTVGFARK